MKTYEHTVIHHVQTTKHHTFRTDTEEPCWAKGPLTLRGFYKAEAEMLHAARCRTARMEADSRHPGCVRRVLLQS